MRTVAGNGEKGVPAEGQDALTQPLVDPRAIAVDTTGRVYILERNGHALRVVERNGKIHTVAGNGTPGFSGDGGPAREALLRGPKHISIDQDDNVLIADTENHVIRRYSPRTGLITRVAGTGTAGASGVGGPAAEWHAQPSAWRADASGHARDLHLRQRQSPRAARRAALSARLGARQSSAHAIRHKCSSRSQERRFCLNSFRARMRVIPEFCWTVPGRGGIVSTPAR